MTHLLLTGGAGFIGAHMVEHYLKNTDWEITTLVSYRHKGCPTRLRHLEGDKRLHILWHDLRGAITPELQSEIGRIDFVIHAAAESHVQRSIDDPVPFVRNNVDVTLNMLEYARRADPEVFVQVSTDEVYGPTDGTWFHGEDDPIRPSNPYAASKAAQEAIAHAYARSYGIRLITTNTMNNYGERQDLEKFIPSTIRKVMNDEPVSIHWRQGEVGSRCWLHARNHADAILFLLTKMNSLEYADRYNVVGEPASNLEIAQTIAKVLGRELNSRFEDIHSTSPGHDLHYGLSGHRLQTLGWRPPVGWYASLERTIKWTADHYRRLAA